jgi:hypothetical protein
MRSARSQPGRPPLDRLCVGREDPYVVGLCKSDHLEALKEAAADSHVRLPVVRRVVIGQLLKLVYRIHTLSNSDRDWRCRGQARQSFYPSLRYWFNDRCVHLAPKWDELRSFSPSRVSPTGSVVNSIFVPVLNLSSEIGNSRPRLLRPAPSSGTSKYPLHVLSATPNLSS